LLTSAKVKGKVQARDPLRQGAVRAIRGSVAFRERGSKARCWARPAANPARYKARKASKGSALAARIRGGIQRALATSKVTALWFVQG